MPIRPENRANYKSAAYRDAREQVRVRAHDHCESCGAPNGRKVFRFEDPVTGKKYWTLKRTSPRYQVWFSDGVRSAFTLPVGRWQETEAVMIQLGCAHLNQDPADHRLSNLAFLCRGCHLRHDAASHAVKARATRQTRKDESRPLLRACRVCGCTEVTPCVDYGGDETCGWFSRDLCTFCAESRKGDNIDVASRHELGLIAAMGACQ